jgi:hypothetical protein
MKLRSSEAFGRWFVSAFVWRFLWTEKIFNQWIDEKKSFWWKSSNNVEEILCVALNIDNTSTKSIQGQPYIRSKIPWLKVIPSLETIMILLNELRDIYVCFRYMVTMKEAIEERMYPAKRTTLSFMTCFNIDAIMWPRIWNITSIGNWIRNLNLFSDPGALL